MELPPAIIAQAEAAAISNSTEIDYLAQSTTSPNQAPPESSSDGSAKQEGHTSSNQLDSSAQTHGPSATQARNPGLEVPAEKDSPPAYSGTYGEFDCDQDGFDTRARVANDGRVNININQTSRRLSNLLVPALRSQLNLDQVDEPSPHPPGYIPPSLSGLPGQPPPPPLNVVIHVVGSRGDVQPFVALGQVLKNVYGHRVRLATHPTFREFVEENGLEFFSIGGDPAELMAFMVKNPGLMPGIDTLRSGDVGKRRKGMYEIFKGCWRSCFEAGDGTGIEASDDHLEGRSSFDSGISLSNDLSLRPFVADAIIANPPSFAHIHCAEKLGIPLHLMFTMPYSPTQAFPHPLANIQSSNADANISNFVSYALVEMLTWQGLGDMINRFREKSLSLEPVSLMWAPGMASRLRIPYTYCWSPALIPKPKDWGPHISISGFYFLSLSHNFTPAPELMAFLNAGPPPVYIGFGSIVVNDPNAMTRLIFEAVEKSGQRALVSKGWGGFGADTLGIPDNIFMLGNVPHDWLFKHVSCVVHHGGAGTTAAGIALGKPTVIVPFFGDQPFWGAMVAKAGAGPLPIPNKQLTSDNLAAAINEALKPTALQRARELGAKIASEKGTEIGAQSFHGKLNVDSLRCTLAPSRAAVWRVKRTNIRLSAFAAATLGNEGLLDFSDLKLYRPREYDSEDGPWDPISGGASALLGTIGSLMMGFADFPVEVLVKTLRIKSPANVDSREGSTSTTTNISNTTDDNSSSSISSATVPSSYERNARSTNSPNTSSAISQSDTVDSKATDDPQSPLRRSTSGSDNANISKTRTSGSRGTSLAQALGKIRTRSPSQGRSGHHFSDCEAGQISLEAAVEAGKGVGRIVSAGVKSPMDFTLSLARGFHNAPKLYGDATVRQPEKITGLQSGLKAAGKEFGFGFYDGISGLVTQPLEGAKREGVAGLFKGFGKGIGGVVLKPGAAIFGIPGYTFKGIYKELQKHLGSSVQNYIIAARTAQGFEDWKNSTREERVDVVSRWTTTQVELSNAKRQSHQYTISNHSFTTSRSLNVDERKKHAKDLKKQEKAQRLGATPQVNRDSGISETALRQTRTPVRSGTDPESAAFEEAIQTSVAATSRGNEDEDRLIERAIRASVRELRLASREGSDEDAIQRAIGASVAEAIKVRTEGAGGGTSNDPQTDGNGSGQLAAALHRSLQEHAYHDEKQVHHDDVEWDDSGIDTDDDENMKLALKNSKHVAITEASLADDGDFQRALEQSRQAHERSQQEELQARTEEEIVLQYVKKQSLAEEQHKALLIAQGRSAASHELDNDQIEHVS